MKDENMKNLASAENSIDRVLKSLNKEYIVVGKNRINSWYAWLAIGLMVGVVSGVIFLNYQKSNLEYAGLEFASSSGSTPSQNYVPGEILLKFKDRFSSQDQDKFLKARGLTVKDEIKQIKVKVVSVPEEAEDEIIRALSHRPEIEFVERNAILPPSFIPNDPSYGSQWHHPKINDPAAWDIANGSSLAIGIADTGVDPAHPDLVANLIPGWNFYDNNSNTADVHGHGTKVAGTQAAVGNNSIQVAGISWNTKIMPLRVSDTSGYAYYSTISSAITYAADRGVKTVNVSFGGVCGSGAIASAADYMYKKGGIVVVGAGNDGTLVSCSDNPKMVFASATDSADNRASWSSYGPYVDVAAPGVGICTTTNGGGTGCVSGTSFSSPITAGVLTLIWSANSALTPGQAEQILFDSAKDLGDLGRDQYYGWGRVDAGAAVTLAKNTQGPPPDTIAPMTSVNSPVDGTAVAGTISVSVSANDNIGVSKVELWKDGVLFSTDTVSPYSYFWDTTEDVNGSHTLQSKAYDAAGNVGISSVVTVNVNNVQDSTAPTVNITKPVNGFKLPSKGNVKISVNAADNIGVSEIDIFFDNILRKSCFGATACSYNLSVNKVSSGTHSITVKAYDVAGNVGSASISVVK